MPQALCSDRVVLLPAIKRGAWLTGVLLSINGCPIGRAGFEAQGNLPAECVNCTGDNDGATPETWSTPGGSAFGPWPDRVQWRSASGGGISGTAGHAACPGIALDGAGQPIVSWGQPGISGANSIIVRRFDGTRWNDLGAPIVTDDPTCPALVRGGSSPSEAPLGARGRSAQKEMLITWSRRAVHGAVLRQRTPALCQ